MNLRNHNWRVVFKVLTKQGFIVRHHHGSHILMGHEDGRRVTIVRDNPIKLGTLRSILKQAGITPEEFENGLR